MKRPAGGADFAVRFVDDDRGPPGPPGQAGGVHRDGAVQRLLDEDQVLEKTGQRPVGGEFGPELPEGLDLLEVFVSVEGEGVLDAGRGRFPLDHLGDLPHAIEIFGGVAP